MPGHANPLQSLLDASRATFPLHLLGWGKTVLLGTLPTHRGSAGRSIRRQLDRFAAKSAMVPKLIKIAGHGLLPDLIQTRLA